ncbi:MAG: hypothetical protein R3314_13000, partial [Longimicrobiales bacterium]|nr:hypothetical protein [Longimicrobiales bacterium]
GPDGTVWGGELLLGGAGGYERVGHLRPFRLPGGDAAVKEPRRMALALCHAAWGEEGTARALRRLGPALTTAEIDVLGQVLETGFRAPWTTSAGRLFDGVASLLGLRQTVGFEGEAAMALEHAVDPAESGAYPFAVRRTAGASVDAGPLVIDWAPAVGAMLDDVEAGEGTGVVAARFHSGLAVAVGQAAEAVGEPRVALTGGVFQNRVLTERTRTALEGAGLRPLLHRRVPANDGGLSLGQIAVAAAGPTGEAN